MKECVSVGGWVFVGVYWPLEEEEGCGGGLLEPLDAASLEEEHVNQSINKLCPLSHNGVGRGWNNMRSVHVAELLRAGVGVSSAVQLATTRHCVKNSKG